MNKKCVIPENMKLLQETAASVSTIGVFGKTSTPHSPSKRNKYIKFSWVPDLPDHRDYHYESLIGIREKAFPNIVDLRPTCSPIEDQGALGSCSGNALVGDLEFLENKYKIPFQDLSRLFVYYNERLIEGTVKVDSGATLRDGMKALHKYGVCPELMWPYVIKKFATKPTDVCYKEGLKHVINSYYRITSLDGMKQCLTDGFPFVFGFTVYESFMSSQVAKTGIVPMPSRYESMIGGHAVCCVGFSEDQQRFIIRNSWGKFWGQNGYFTMPYEYLSTTHLSDDFWTIRK